MRSPGRLLAIIALALMLLLVTRASRTRRVSLAPPADPQSGASSEALLVTGERADERSPLGKRVATTPAVEERVQVRSALGLPLDEVELEDERGWQRQVLDRDGTFVLSGSLRPRRVRARGHRPALIEHATRELALEPHTSIRFTSFPLARVESWTPAAHAEVLRDATELLLTAGPLDATSFALAFDADGLRALFSSLTLEFRIDDGTRVRVDHRLVPGRHDTVTWPWPPETVLRSSIEVRLSGTHALAGPFTLWAHSAVDAQPETRADHARHEWGAMTRLRQAESWQLDALQPGFELGPLVLGKEYIVTARDLASGAHARLRFPHDGAPALELVLTDGLVVSGRVTFEPASGVRELERVTWSLGRARTPYWSGEPGPIPLGPQGEFRFTLPDPVPWADQAPYPRPTELEFELHVPGFLPYPFSSDTAGISELALGTLALTPRVTALTLAPGHGLEARALHGQTLVLARDGTFAQEHVIAGGLPLLDGRLALTLDEDLVPRELETCDALLLDVDGTLLPLVRSPQGFERSPALPRTLRLAVGEALAGLEERLELGIEWRGMLYACRSWPTRALREPTELELVLPSDATAWWGLGRKPENRRNLVLPAEGVVELHLP